MSAHLTKSKDFNALDHVKPALELAKAGLTGIGILDVEAIAAVPLELIAILGMRPVVLLSFVEHRLELRCERP